MMNCIFKKSIIAFIFFVCTSPCFSQTETFSTGSFIINMGATNPNTIGNGLKPYGLIYDLIRNYKCPVKWIIGQTKIKDGVDFTYNGVSYKGGTFIIPKEFRTAAVDARIAYWQTQGVQGVTTISPFTVDVYRTLISVPKWTLDKQNGRIAEKFLFNAGINNTAFPGAYNWNSPAGLGPCDDLFVMPHADPTWKTHGNLYNWNRTYLGSIWSDCHAVSVLENMVNPANAAQQTNFLSTNGLINFGNHDRGSPPYIHRYPNEPVSQYMGLFDDATTNGSEQIYIPDPAKSSVWRPTTKIIAYDPTHKNVPVLAPDLSNAAAPMVYGRGFGNSNYGWVTYLGGHNQDKGGMGGVAAQRSFFNFCFFQVIEKSPVLPVITPISATQPVPNGTSINLSIGNATSPVLGVTFTYQWFSSCGGTFTPASGSGQNVTWLPPTVASPATCIISCVVTDNCGRSSIQTIPLKLAGPPQGPSPQPDSSVITPVCGENMSIMRNVLLNDTDTDGRPLTLTSVTGATNGTVSFTASGDVTYTPNPNFFGVEILNYQVCNNAPLCANSTYKITVGDPSLIPVVVNDAYTIVEDNIARFTVLANDGAGLTVMAIPTAPSFGKVSVNLDNTITYMPNTDFTGTDNFTYKVTNAAGYTKSATVTITVTTDGCSGGTYETAPAYSGTTTFNPLADGYYVDNNPLRNFGACINILIDGESSKINRGLLRFDLASATPLTGSPIPAAATTITSATLSMVATAVQSNNPYAIDIRKITNAWNEGNLCDNNNTAASNGATWGNRNFITSWTTAGGDYNAAIEATTNVSTTGAYDWGITNLVQSWLSAPAANYGLLMKFNSETTGNQLKTFASKENSTVANRPVLSATWYVPHVCSPIPIRAPMAMPDSATTPNGVAVNISTAANDYYPNAGTKTYSILTAPVSGSASINSSTGVVTYTPATTFNGVRSMSYRVVNTTTGLADTAYVYVNITNGPMVANNDLPAGDSSGVVQTISVKANDTDPEFSGALDNSYTVTISTAPKKGTATVDAGGNIIYTPYTDFSGADTLFYTICEPNPSTCGVSACSTARLIVTVFNRPPVAIDDVGTTLPCQPITMVLVNNDTDPENGVLSVTNVSAISPPGSGTLINNNDGSISFTPATGFTGSVTFTYTATDNGIPSITSAPANVTINVAPIINNPPIGINDYADTTLMDQVSITNVLDNDSDPENNDLINFAIAVPPLHGTVTLLPNGLVNYIPNPGFYGADTLTYQVCDLVYNPGNCLQAPSLCVTAQLFLYVQAPNLTVAINDENSTWIKDTVSGSVMFNDFDPEGDTQIFSGFKNSAGTLITAGTIAVSGTDLSNNPVANAGNLTVFSNGDYIYKPAQNFVGIADIKYFITDSRAIPATDSANLKITVNYFPKNVNSIIANNDEFITYGNALTQNVTANDKDPQGDLVAITSFKYDANGDGIKEATGIAGSAYVIGGITSSGLPVTNAGSIIFNGNGSFTFTPAVDFHGLADILYTVCDNYSTPACATSTLKMIILPDVNGSQNEPPIAGDDFNIAPMNMSVNGNFIANDYDPKGDPIAMNGVTLNPSGAKTPIGTAVTTAAGGAVQYYTDGTYTYTPLPGYVGPDSTGYSISDITFVPPQPLITKAFLHFLVSGFNTILPLNDVNNTWVNIPVNGNVLTNDQDPEDNALTITYIRDASNLLQSIVALGTTVNISGKDKNGNPVANAGSIIIYPNGSYTYTPANNFAGTAITKYSVCDNGTPQVCKEVNITISVNNVPLTNGTSGVAGNNITIANDDAKGTIVNTVINGNVTMNDNDPEGNIQSFQSFLNQNGTGSTIVSGATVSGLDTAGNTTANAGSITFTNTGDFTFTPTAGFIGTVIIPYKTCDNGSPIACDDATLTISIVLNINRSINKRPVGTDNFSIINNFLNPGSFTTGNVLANDIDPGSGNAVNGTALSIQNTGSFTTAQGGTIAISSNGNYTYIPNSSYTGPDQFIYTLCDNGTPALCSKATLYFLDIAAPTVLPISQLNFNGKLLTNANLLNWVTTNETKTSRFEIETKTDVTAFKAIATVAAKGSGNQNEYNFVHQNPGAGVNYYRLKVIDIDGKYSYSNTITLKRNGSSIVINQVNPNPFKNKITATVNLDKASFIYITMYDANGSLIKKEYKQAVKGVNIFTLTGLEKLSSGIYFLEIKGDHNILRSKLFKAD